MVEVHTTESFAEIAEGVLDLNPPNAERSQRGERFAVPRLRPQPFDRPFQRREHTQPMATSTCADDCTSLRLDLQGTESLG